MHYAIYNKGTGEIVTAVMCDDVQWPEKNVKIGQGIIFEPASPHLEMVKNEAIVPRPKLAQDTYSIQANGVDEVQFAIPLKTIIRYGGVVDVAEDTSFVFRTAIPRVYTLYLEPPFPYQLQQIEITAHASL